MRKVVVAFVVLLTSCVVLFVSPFIYLGFKNVNHRRALQNRSDYPQIALAAVAFAQSMTNEEPLILSGDSRVPKLLRSLSPRYLSASTNYVTMEFHGGFDHYGYKIRKVGNDSNRWTISWYTEQSEKTLATVTANSR